MSVSRMMMTMMMTTIITEVPQAEAAETRAVTEEHLQAEAAGLQAEDMTMIPAAKRMYQRYRRLRFQMNLRAGMIWQALGNNMLYNNLGK